MHIKQIKINNKKLKKKLNPSAEAGLIICDICMYLYNV